MIRRLVPFVLPIVLVAGLIAGCSGRGPRTDASRGPRTAGDSLADWRGRADSLDATRGSLEQVRGQLAHGIGTSTWTAWFDSGGVRVLHEALDLGARGSRSNRYYFERGFPRLTVETGRVPADSALRLVPLERVILFDDLGRLVAATMMLDSVKTWVGGDEATAVLDRARRLLAGAEGARAARGAGALPGVTKPANR